MKRTKILLAGLTILVVLGVITVALHVQGRLGRENTSNPILIPPEATSKTISEEESKAASMEEGEAASDPLAVVSEEWTAQGPGPTLFGQVENIIPNNEVVGAIHTVAPHPTDPNILFVGGVNSGIWRTTNATAVSPDWTPLTDNLTSLSIGALEFDPTDLSHQTLIAGIGRFSSFNRAGGPLTGILRTTDGGDNWTSISHPLLVQNISGVAARGATLLASANTQFVGITGGLFRSIDGGNNWVLVSGSNGLATGGAFDLVGAKDNLNRFYVSVQRTGIFRSDDGGATWTNISSGDATLNGIITNAGNINAEMAVAGNGRLYVVVVNAGRAQYIGFSDNPAAETPTWTAMDLPRTLEANGQIEGLHPGGQGSIHLSIAVDPNDPNTVYVAGDRQDNPFPNFIGARDFSGRLFRGDTTVAPTGALPSPQWEHLTHLNSIPQIPGGGTASGSSPHADSREMTFDANGALIEVDDGGIYRRTNPQNNTGDWFSINGNIQTTEFHDIAYDSISNILIGGAQDTGTPQQIIPGVTTWRSVSTADGGDVAVDNITLAAQNQSIRYSSFQNLGAFRRDIFGAANNFIVRVFPALTVVGGGAPLQPSFITPVELNAIDPRRLVIGGANSVYESFNLGDTITEINGPGTAQLQNAIAYGGRSEGVDNLDILYLGSGAAVFVRTTAGAALAPTAALPAGAGTVRDIVLDSDDWRIAYVVDSDQVFRTTDAGASWTEIIGNLALLGAGDFRTTEFIAGPKDVLVVGTNAGGFVSSSSSGFTSWSKLGAGLPAAPVWDLDYNAVDDVMAVGAMGRGAWTITKLRDLTRLTADLSISKTVSANSALTGSDLTYTITLTNNGPDAAASVTVADILPGATTFISCAATNGGVCSGAGNNRAITFASLAPGASGAITLVVNVKCSVADGTIVSNTATVDSATFDPEQNNNIAIATTTASNPPPIITLNPSISLWPPNHKYHTVTVAQMVQSVSDNCPISIDDVVIERVTSDEPDNAPGDGNTINDIVIGADCRSVQLRAERAGPGDGRVYTVTLRLRDSGGAVTRVDFQVSVPHSQNGVPAVKGPVALTVMSACQSAPE